MKKVFTLLIAAAMLLFTGLTTVNAATINVPADQPTIQAAISVASNGDEILVATGTYNYSTTIIVNKDVTISGVAGSTYLTTTGTSYLFDVQSSGVTISNLKIQKTDDNVAQNIIYVGASNFELSNCEISAQYVMGDSEVTRGIVTTGGLTGFYIHDNIFHNLRQPAYTEKISGQIVNNYTYVTRGWVISVDASITFSGNTWGTGADVNYYDIALILNTPPAIVNNYPDIVAMSAANNNAIIENQFTTPALLSIVHVDGSVATTGNGSILQPYKTITEALPRVAAGGKILVAAGTYSEFITVNKSCQLIGSNAGRHPAVGTHPTEIVGPRLPETILNNLSPAADNIVVDGFKFLKAGTRIIDTYSNANGFTLKNCIVESTAFGSTTGVIQFGGGSHTNCIFEFNLFTDKGDHTFYAGGGPYDNLKFQYNKFQSENDAIFWAASALTGGVFDGNEFDGESGSNYNTINIGQAGNLQIKNNWFHDNKYTAVQVGIIGGSVTENTFERTYVYGSGYGSYAFQLWGGAWGTAISTNVTIENNKIHYNDVVGATEMAYGIGLNPPANVGDPSIDASTIHVHNNSFIDGGIQPGSYAIRHRGNAATILDATCNWWGTTNAATIAGMVYGNATVLPFSISDGGACIGGVHSATIGAPVPSACGTLHVPITVGHFNNVANISLTLTYDIAKLTYQGVDINPAFADAYTNGALPGIFLFSRQVQSSEITLPDNAVLFTLHFNILPSAIAGSTTAINWDLSDPVYCEFSGGGSNPVIYASAFVSGSATIPVRPVVNTTTGNAYCTIQAAIDAASAGNTITVAAGTYPENVVVNKPLTLKGANAGIACAGRGAESTIAAPGGTAVAVEADGVTIDGFEITNPAGNYAVTSTGRNNLLVQYNNINNIGTLTVGGPVHAIAIIMGAANTDNVDILYNCISNINNVNNIGSGNGIGVGWSTATTNITNLNIAYNTISDVNSKSAETGGKGAYGIIVNVGASATGQATNPVIEFNTIHTLAGKWSHAIGLEGNTPGAVVQNNLIYGLTSTKSPVDAVGVMIEQNTGVLTLGIHNNSFTNLAYGVLNVTALLADATCNWYGAGVVKNAGSVTVAPWLISGVNTIVSGPGFVPQVACAVCAIQLPSTHVDVSCPGSSDGSIDLTVTGAITPVTYSWTGPNLYASTSEDISGLIAGDYTVTVTGTNGCTATTTVTVGTVPDVTPPTITGTMTVLTVSGCAAADAPTAVTTVAALELMGAIISDNCTDDAVMTVSSADVAAGTCPIVVTRTYTVRDGSLNPSTITQTINIVHQTAPGEVGGPAVTASTVECVSAATEPTTLPTVQDMCGNPLTPGTPVMKSVNVKTFDETVLLGTTSAADVWYTDRYAPNGFAKAPFDGGNRLKHSIAATDGASSRPGSFSSAFYNTQGRKYDLGASTDAVEVKLYIPADWATSNKRMAGLWGTAFNVSNAVSAYPIVEFNSDGGVPRFRAWEADGTWVDMGLPAGFAYGSWVTLKIKLLSNGQFLVSAGSLNYVTKKFSATSVKLANVILQGHNYDPVTPANGVTYDIYWDDFTWNDTYTAIACEGTVSYTYNYADCAGLAYAWTYTYTVDDNTAPSITAPANVTVHMNNGCEATGVVLGTPTKSDNCGGTVTVNNDAPLAFPVGTTTVTWTATDCAGNSATSLQTVTVLTNVVSGTLVYNNSAKTPMQNVILTLNPGNLTATTSATGAFSFANLCAGTYTVEVTTNPWKEGGINSTDAGAVNAWSAFFGQIEHVKFLAGDVVLDKFIESADALKIQRYFVFREPFAAATPTWSYWKKGELITNNSAPYATQGAWPTAITVTVAGDVTNFELYGMATGDFNGSLVPTTLKSADPSLVLAENSNLQIGANQQFELPLRVVSPMQVSAVSMILDIPSELVKVQDVKVNGSNEPVMWTVNGNELRIGWNSLTPVNLAGDGALVTLKLSTSAAFTQGQTLDISMPFNSLNELADGNHDAIEYAELMVAKVGNQTVGNIAIDKEGGLLFSNYPNPFSKETMLEYSLPADGKVTINLYNNLGQLVSVLVDADQTAGQHMFRYESNALQPGIYVAKLRLVNSETDVVGTIKLSVQK